MTPTCQSGVQLLMDYLEGVLAPEVSATLERHVAACARCTAFIESYRRTPDILRRVTTPTIPAELAGTLQDLLRREPGDDPER